MSTLRKTLGRYKRKILGAPPAPVREAAKPQPARDPLEEKRADLAQRRTMGPHAWEFVMRLAKEADEVITDREASARAEVSPRALMLRHDIDHDIENAVRIAEREAAEGLRATYYALHSAWYYRFGSGDELSPLMLRALERIMSLGHDVGLHNNVIAVAMSTGRDPAEVLHTELSALRAHGFEIHGTVAHGDKLCRLAGFVNDEVFVESQRPNLGRPAERTITWDDPKTGEHLETHIRPLPRAEFDLEFDAGWSTKRKLALTDTGGRWSRPLPLVEQLVREGEGPLQIMTHPVYWAMSGETVHAERARTPISVIQRTPNEPPPARDPSKPFTIISRGDCCSHRGIAMNKDVFGDDVVFVSNEKARTDFFLEHAHVGSPSHEDVTRYLDVERMSPSLRTYALGQGDRSTLYARDADLLVMDTYSDMNFQAWRHRARGWKMWVHLGFLKDKAEFDRDFEPLGYMSFEDALATHVALIDYYRKMNGHIPVLFLNQPIHLYNKLGTRAEFRTLGPELEKIVPDLYAGDVADDQLDPADLGSCGPGQTLHFTGPSYRKMIDVALEKGLNEWLARIPLRSQS